MQRGGKSQVSLDGEIGVRAVTTVGGGREWEGLLEHRAPGTVLVEGGASSERGAEGTQGERWLLHPPPGPEALILSLVLVLTDH